MSAGKRGGRFGYLTSVGESTETTLPTQEVSGQENDGSSSAERDESLNQPDSSSGGEERRSRTSREDVLTSVPKGQGRMKQERSQLNVRLPTTLKRQASAKAVLEGRDIGEVVEELLREYLER